MVVLCLMVDGASLEQRSLAVKSEGKYGHMIFDRVDNLAKSKLNEKSYEAVGESLTVIAKPKETILRARNILIKDEDSQTAKIVDKVLSKFFLLTIIVGTGFGIVIKLVIWVIGS